VWVEIEKQGHHNGKKLGRVVSVKSRYVLYIPVSMLKKMGLKKAYGVKMMRDLKEPHRIGLQFFEDRAPGLRPTARKPWRGQAKHTCADQRA